MAFAVCAYYGIETDANSFGYIANFTQGKSIEELKNSLDLIGRTADEIITDIDRHFSELMKVRETEHDNHADILAGKQDAVVFCTHESKPSVLEQLKSRNNAPKPPAIPKRQRRMNDDALYPG